MKRFAVISLASMLVLSLSCSSDDTITGGGDDNSKGSFLDQQYVVLAWNDLGMHCLNANYDSLVILPPYNNLWAQVIRRGDPPAVVTAGLQVEFSIENNTSSYDKRSYGQFWDHAAELFGSLFGIDSLHQDVGLTGNGLSGEMEPGAGHFVAEGIPVVPVEDGGTWNPYQVGVITVRNDAGDILAETKCAIPVSDEINCRRCHGQFADTDILMEHDEEEPLQELIAQAPVLCVDCHFSPAYGQVVEGEHGFLSAVIHRSHATRNAACYDCHPGNQTQCSRSLRHTGPGGNCATCHGDMAAVASSIEAGRVPWLDEPACSKCHEDNIPQVATGDILYRNAVGHGNVYCIGCHGSPHAMMPARESIDNYQARQYRVSGGAKTIASCGTCHNSSHPDMEEAGKFLEEHGGSGPEHYNGCHVCHTRITTEQAANWPHAFQWTNSND